jgi:hypothetical protein
MEDERNGAGPEIAGISAEGIGMLVAFLESHRMQQRRHQALHRLTELQSREAFLELPDDLRQRIRELIAESSEGH